MKITKSHLRKIIKEEVSKVLSESLGPHEKGSWQYWVEKASQRTDPDDLKADLNNAVEVFIHHNGGDVDDLRALASNMAEEYAKDGLTDFAKALNRYMEDESFERYQR